MDSLLVEKVARAICAADTYAPDPDDPIYIGMKPAKAWEGRIEMAVAAIAAIGEAMDRLEPADKGNEPNAPVITSIVYLTPEQRASLLDSGL